MEWFDPDIIRWISMGSVVVIVGVIIRFIMTLRSAKEAEEKTNHQISDDETKLYNKVYFDAMMEQLTALSRRNKEPLSVLFFSIDNFDAFQKTNESQEILKLFGTLLLSLIRTSDVACRVDTNNFAIIAPQTDVDQARIFAERVFNEVRTHNFRFENNITMSMALMQYNMRKDSIDFVESSKELMEKAQEIGDTIVTASSNEETDKIPS